MLTIGSWWFADWHPTWHRDLRPLRGMIGYSSKLLATNIFTHINNNLFSLFFGRLYGEREVGYYNQANKWTGMGHTMLTGMVWSVTQPLFARLSYNEPERMQSVFRKMLRLTAFLSCPALFGLALIAPEFITITITSKWLVSAQLMQLLCIGGAFIPISSFYSNFIISQGKSNIFMWNTIALCLAQMLQLVILYPYGVKTMVIAYVVTNTLWLFVWHAFVRYMIGLRLRDALRDVLPFVALSAIAMLLAWGAAQPVKDNIYLSLIVKVAVAVLVHVKALLTVIVPERKLVCRHVDRLVLDVYARSQQRARRHIGIRGCGPTIIGVALVKHHLAEPTNTVGPYTKIHRHVVTVGFRFTRFEGCREQLPPEGLASCCNGKVPECRRSTFLCKAHIHVVVKTTVNTRPHARRVVG